jgi:hypothetical protein
MSEQKIEQFWRDATADDVARVMRGERVEARFRDEYHEWRYGEYLGGVHRGNCEEFKWKDRDGVPWKQCQVYNPPAWYINKPEPGEGCRLLEKFPHEDKLATDEAWATQADCWQVVQNDNGVQEERTWYRRRIANSPTSSDSSRSRDNIPTGWRLLGKDEERLASDAYWSQACRDWIVIGDDRVAITNELRRLHAIRQVVFPDYRILRVDHIYAFPNGQTIRITAKGFEVGS